MRTESLTHDADGSTLDAHLAYDETLSTPRPGIIVVPDAFGLADFTRARADRLAKEFGYVALATDIFGEPIRDFAHAMEWVGAFQADPHRLRARARSALALLAANPRVDATRLGGIGFCIGGTTVIELVRDGAGIAAVSFHGGLETGLPAEKGVAKGRVLSCTGGDDPMIPAAARAAFEVEMNAAGLDWQMNVYGGARHSFTDPGADSRGIDAIRYHAPTDRRSWMAMRAFFDEAFV